MDSTNARDLLIGKETEKTKRWGLVSIVLLFASFAYFAGLNAFTGYGWPVHLFLWSEGYAVLLTTLITVQAYSNEGIVVSWLLAFAPVVGLVMNLGGIGLAGEPPELLRLIGLSLAGGLIAAVTLGTLGFITGVALRTIYNNFVT